MKILLTSTANGDNSLESCFWPLNKMQNIADKIASSTSLTTKNNANVLEAGIDGIVQLLKSNKLTPEIVPNYAKMVFKGRLEVLFASSLGEKEYREKSSDGYKDALNIASKYYDIVFVDLCKGINNAIAKDILSIADVVVINITQSLPMLDDYIKFSMENLTFDMKKAILSIGRYDIHSKYNVKNVARYIQSKQNIYAVPYNTVFYEAMGEGNAAHFFLKYRKVSEKNEHFRFIQEVRKLSEAIIEKLAL